MNEEDKNEIKTEIKKKAETPKAPLSKRIPGFFYDLAEMLGVITVIIILCFSFAVRLNVVDGESMEQTLYTGEYLVVSDLLYTPTRGDIIVVQSPVAAASYRKPLVKRIIATEGQLLEIDTVTGAVTVDGEPVDESSFAYYKNDMMFSSWGEHMTVKDGKASITVPEGCVFVMGDNRNNSADSRYGPVGPIDVRCIVGKVYARVFPLDKFTLFHNPLNAG